MAKKTTLPAPRFEFWRNSKKEFNYRTIGKNGKSIGGEQHQGFKTLEGIRKNISAHAELFGVHIDWDKNAYEFTRPDGISIPLIEVKK